MGKLNQVIAVVAGKKKAATESITQAYHKIQKADLFNGISRSYQPKDEDGERLPSEQKLLQVRVEDLIEEVRKPLTEMFDIVITQDCANTIAETSLEVGNVTIFISVPVTYLLFLEKQLVDLATFVSKIPTLDPAEEWHWNENVNCSATDASETVRTKKVPKAFVKYEATKEHPAQVETFTEDVTVGYWRTVKYSGAITAQAKNAMLDRVRQLQEAVTKAREEANSIEVSEKHIGKAILDFVFKV